MSNWSHWNTKHRNKADPSLEWNFPEKGVKKFSKCDCVWCWKLSFIKSHQRHQKNAIKLFSEKKCVGKVFSSAFHCNEPKMREFYLWFRQKILSPNSFLFIRLPPFAYEKDINHYQHFLIIRSLHSTLFQNKSCQFLITTKLMFVCAS